MKINKLILSIIFCLSLNIGLFADDLIWVLNPDPYSQSAGASILALSPSVFGFFTNPASNYKKFSKELQFSYMSYYDRNYGGNIGFVLPTEKSGNFTFVVSGMDWSYFYKNFLMAAINYVYPIAKKFPSFVEKGAIGATLRFYNISLNTDDDSSKSINLFSFDLGFIYSLDFIDDDLMGAIALKNFGNDFDIEFLSEGEKKQSQNFSASLRYFLSEDYKVSIMADLVKNFQIMDLGYACAVETIPFYPFSLRIGWRDYRDNLNKGITAGFALNFDKVNIAYSFSDLLDSDDDQHIFSLGFVFGKISDTGKAYDHYVGYYLKKAKDEYNRKNYISAKKQFEDILSVYPNEPVSKHYVQLLSEDLDQSERDFASKIEKYLARADSALLRRDFVKAQKYYTKVLQIDSSNATAREGIVKVNEQIKEQEIYANRKRHQKEITEHWIKAMKHYENGEFIYAKDELKKITDIDPTNAGALQYLEIIQKKVDKVNSVQSNNLFKQGLTEYEQNNYEKALSYFNAAYLSDPSRTDIKDYIDKCEVKVKVAKKMDLEDIQDNNNEDDSALKTLTNKQVELQMKKLYETGLEQYSLKNYKASLKSFNQLKALSDKHKYYEYNEQIKTYTIKSKKAISKQLYTEGRELELKEKLAEAYEKYKEAVNLDDSNSMAKKSMEKINSIIAQQYYDQGLQSFSVGDKDKAIKLLEKSLEVDPNKIESKRALERIQNQ
jgi:tetratricopeptide (TPR) repeat protein